MTRNPLLTGDDSGNPLSLAPWQVGDPTDPMAVAGAQTGADPLTQWLAAMRAKNEARRFLPGTAEGDMPPMSEMQAYIHKNWPATPIPNNNVGAAIVGQPIPNNNTGLMAGASETTEYQDRHASPMMRWLQRMGWSRPGVDI